MATLRDIPRPDRELTEDPEQGGPIVVKGGWLVRGFRDADGNYYERATRGSREKWFRLDPDPEGDR